MSSGILPIKKIKRPQVQEIVSQKFLEKKPTSKQEFLKQLENENLILKKELNEIPKSEEIDKNVELLKIENEKIKQQIKERNDNISFVTLNKKLSNEEKLNNIRNYRNKLLQDTIWVKEKYECQLKEKQIGMTSATDVSQKKYEEWLQYWKDLRNLPNKIKSKDIDINNFKFPSQPI